MSSCSPRLRPSFHGLTAKEAKAQSYIASAQMSEADSQEVIRPAKFHVRGMCTLSPTFGISSATSKFVSSSEFPILDVYSQIIFLFSSHCVLFGVIVISRHCGG
ncbi:hypothetical protein H1C71_026251 [Ictidomys tridecemlineatus]|nr:hypothetical protein H1C71_026251 [Ictidomys tridecemlineatus]